MVMLRLRRARLRLWRFLDRIIHLFLLRRLPPSFDHDSYYSKYSDVAESNRDAGVHYLRYGISEGRSSIVSHLSRHEAEYISSKLSDMYGVDSDLDKSAMNINYAHVEDGKSFGFNYELLKLLLSVDLYVLNKVHIIGGNHFSYTFKSDGTLFIIVEKFDSNIFNLIEKLAEVYGPLLQFLHKADAKFSLRKNLYTFCIKRHG